MQRVVGVRLHLDWEARQALLSCVEAVPDMVHEAVDRVCKANLIIA